MLVKIFFVLFVFDFTSKAQLVDRSEVPGAVGTDVTIRCIARIKASGIFGEDNGMTRKMAYVESADGVNMTANGTGGIWQITATSLGKLMDETYNVSSLYISINTAFGIDWATVAYNDLNKPLYSALAARLILAHAETNEGVVISDSLSQQYQLWSFYFYDSTPPLIEEDFKALANQLPTKCYKNLRDLIIMVDSSSRITNNEFDSVKSFLKDIVSYFTVSSIDTRISIVQYSSSQETILPLNKGTNLSVVEAAISNLILQNSHPVYTGAAIISAYVDFLFSGRGTSNGVAHVMMIVTENDSEDDFTTAQSLAVLAEADIIAIGYGPGVSQSELTSLASGVNVTHALLVSDAASLFTITETVQETICSEQATVTDDSAIQGTLQLGRTQSFDVNLPSSTTFQFFTTRGTAICYLSTQVREPSSAAYDVIAIANEPNVVQSFTYTPADTAVLENNVFFAIEGTSSEPADFVVNIGTPTVTVPTTSTLQTTTLSPATTTTTASRPSSDNASTSSSTTETTPSALASSPLGDAEIAIIILACLIFFIGLVIALVYYCFNCRGKSVGVLRRKASTDIAIIPVVGFKQKEAQMPLGQEQLNPEFIARRELRTALSKHDVVGVAAALKKFRTLKLLDKDGDVIRGEHLINLHQCKAGLNYSMQQRNIQYLESAIYETKNKNFADDLKTELLQAEMMLANLKKIEDLMSRLKKALDSEDLPSAEQICSELRSLTGCSQQEIDRMLDIHICKGDLEMSMVARDLELVTKALDLVHAKGYEPELPVEVKLGKKMKKELEFLERARTDILNLKASEVSEIRSYSNPPAGVHDVMSAVYVLLGYNAADVKNWSNIQGLMARTGKESLRRQVLQISPGVIDLERAQQAKRFVEAYSLENVETLSLALSMFYTFVDSMIQEIEKANSQSVRTPFPFSDLLGTSATSNQIWEQSQAEELIKR